jgi:hypothetical protein
MSASFRVCRYFRLKDLGSHSPSPLCDFSTAL